MPSTSRLPARLAYLAGALFCAALIAFALYLQYVQGEDPCPLCIFQRIAVIATGAVFLVAALHGPGHIMARVYAALVLLTAGTGAAIAARHIWIQHLPPDQVPSCGPGLSYLMDVFPLATVVKQVLSGSGECAHVGWTFLGWSIPEWTLLCFIALGAWGVIAAVRFAPRRAAVLSEAASLAQSQPGATILHGGEIH